jgi:hypothetical protein
MNFGKTLAIVMVFLSIGAAIGYAFAKDWRHAAYWMASAVLISCVTF